MTPNAFSRFLLLGSITLILGACGGGGGSSRSNLTPSNGTPAATPVTDQVVNTFAYRPGSSYASVLRECTYAGDSTRACTLGTLPFLGQDAANPAIEDVMQRVLVSHDWMGENLELALQQLPADLLLMLRSITAVVIASDIRPAYYDPSTGAMYLDADYLWLTPAQQADVSDEPDYRSGFGDALQFAMPWRYVRNNERLGIRLNPDGSRPLEQLLPILGFLLYHELAHAVDFMPPDKMARVSMGLTVENAITSGAFLSTSWANTYPLNSGVIRDLAQVSFRGETATAAQQALLPNDLVADFTADGATQYYAYSTQFEDFATAFETVMMNFHFGYAKDTGITTNEDTSNDGIIAWGQRGRIGEQNTNTRARAAVQALYAGDLSAVEQFLSALPAPLDMTPGDSWGQSLLLEPIPGPVSEPLSAGEFDDVLSRRAIH